MLFHIMDSLILFLGLAGIFVVLYGAWAWAIASHLNVPVTAVLKFWRPL